MNRGDDGFTEFVRTRGDHHLRIAVLLTGDWHAGEDLAQASLAKLYSAWTRLDTETGLDAYLHRIMINTHRSWWRARWRHEVPTADLPDPGYGDDAAERHALAASVRQALARLPRQQRAVLVLRFFADMSEAEVARILGCSAGSVKTHAFRGLRALREQFADDDGTGPVGSTNPALDGVTAGEPARGATHA